MSTAGPDLSVFLAAGLLERKGELLVLGESWGPAQPDTVDELARLARARLPEDLGGLAITEGALDAQVGYVLARELALPLCLFYDAEGVGHVRGPLPAAGPLALVTPVLTSSWAVPEFHGLCEKAGIEAGPVVALVDWLTVPSPFPVVSIVRRHELRTG